MLKLIPDFFEPVELHLQASDFAIQPVRCAVRRYRLWASFAFEQRLGLLLDLFLPLAHLHRMNAVLLTNFIDRLDSPQGLQSDLRLERIAFNE